MKQIVQIEGMVLRRPYVKDLAEVGVDSDIRVFLNLFNTLLHLFLGHHLGGPGNRIVGRAEPE